MFQYVIYKFRRFERGSKRYRQAKLIFEHRCAQLDEIRKGESTPENDRAYGSAVTKYSRARARWRMARGWSPN